MKSPHPLSLLSEIFILTLHFLRILAGALLLDMLLPGPLASTLGLVSGAAATSNRSRDSSSSSSSTNEVLQLTRELAPLLPAVATEIMPELSSRLASRIAARFIRENFIPTPAAN